MQTKNNPGEVLKSILASAEFPPAVLIICPDGIRRERAVARIIEHFSKTSATINNLSAQELSLRKIQGLKDKLISLSLFSSRELTHIHNLELLKADVSKELASIVQVSGKGSHLLISGTKLSSSDALYKQVQKNGAILSMEGLEGPELLKWVEKELINRGIKNYQSNAPQTLIDISEAVPDLIAARIEQLALFLDGAELKTQDIFKIFSDRPDPSDYELLDAITQKNVVKSEIILSTLLSSGKSPFLLLSLLARNFSNYFLIRSLTKRGLSSAEIQKSLGMPPWLYQKAAAAASRYSSANLKQSLEGILRADSKLKNYSLGPEMIFSELINKLAA